MLSWWYLILGVIGLGVIYNLYYWLRSRWLVARYEQYLTTKGDWYFSDHKQEVERILRLAGIDDATMPVVEPVGYNHVVTASTGMYRNMHVKRQDVAQFVHSALREARAVFLRRILVLINPVHWLELVIFAPKYLLGYFDVKPDALFTKLAQAAYWLLGFLAFLDQWILDDRIANWIKAVVQ